MVSAPSTSLFVQNINDSIKKDELRRALYSLFSLHGKVIDVVATRAPKMRGMAFVVFRDLSGSTAALRALDGEGFFGKQLRISYSNSISHATIAIQQGEAAVYALKAGLRTAAEKQIASSRLTVSGAQKKALEETNKNKRSREEEVEEEDEEEEDDEPEKKKGKGKSVDDNAMEEDENETGKEISKA